MTRHEAIRQLAAFFLKLGKAVSLSELKKPVKIQIGEAFFGFEFLETEEILSAQALLYRFRNAPKDKVLRAIYAEENETNNGGGRIVFDADNSALRLEKDFAETVGDKEFFEQINRLALSSLQWSSEILQRAAEKANS